jgi:hypothetical protein
MFEATPKGTFGLIVLLMLSGYAGCAATRSSMDHSKEDMAQASRANSANTFDVAMFDATPQLAIEVEVTASDIQPRNVTIVRAPAKANSAMADLQVRTLAGDKVMAEYTVSDPRLVEIERQGQKILPAARTFLYVPLSAALTELVVVPATGREKFVSKGGVLDLRALLQKACREQSGMKECREIIREGIH